MAEKLPSEAIEDYVAILERKEVNDCMTLLELSYRNLSENSARESLRKRLLGEYIAEDFIQHTTDREVDDKEIRQRRDAALESFLKQLKAELDARAVQVDDTHVDKRKRDTGRSGLGDLA